jgi:alkanesulfonate monooxygenase SsuD/methylene tetrahydromethanopterin reductase-like flavin-dependent oxidoreductase (luciferase family)
MSTTQRQMRLGAFFNPTGHHVASWRHPRAQADAGINFQHYVDITRTAERAKFDMVFLADNVCVRDAKMEALCRSAQYIANFEPLTLLSALAPLTSHIGLVATASTSYNEPFHVARKFASLDHLSGGRAGWNLVTSGQEAEARNFNRDKHYLHGERYERAREFAGCGTAGTTMPSSATRNPGSISIPPSSTSSNTRARTIQCGARSTCRAPRRAVR